MLRIKFNDDGPLSIFEAIGVFDQLADQKDIAFGYAYDGCYARAHLMGIQMQEAGLSPGKAWAFESDEDRLRITKSDGTEQTWWYHVAPTLPVRQADGSVIDMVFDPGLFDGPATPEEWGEIMNAKPTQVSVVAWGEPAPGQDGDYGPNEKTGKHTTDSAARKMREYLKHQGKGKRGVYQSRMREQAISEGILSENQQTVVGLTWYTVNLATPDTPLPPGTIAVQQELDLIYDEESSFAGKLGEQRRDPEQTSAFLHGGGVDTFSRLMRFGKRMIDKLNS